MGGYMFQPTRRRRSSLSLMLHSVLLAGSLVATPWLFAAVQESRRIKGMRHPVAMPGWTQQLKGQTVVENTPSRGGRTMRRRWRCSTIV